MAASLINVPANLPELVRAATVRARASGDLFFFPTQVALLRVNGVPFQLRYAPALDKKPTAPQPTAPKPHADTKGASSDKKAFDPFEDPSPPLLVVPQLGPSHRLVLNKFAISRDHAILATSAFRPQTHLLDQADLAAAYACIEAYHHAEEEKEELYVFYNSGRHSGASQPHRHLQLLPVAQMRQGLQGDDASGWGILVDRLANDDNDAGDNKKNLAQVPFYVAAEKLAASPSPEQLHATYLALYRQAAAAAKGTSAYLVDEEAAAVDTAAEESGTVPARISYNLALTKTTMAILPRTAEGDHVLSTGGGGGGGGFISLNGTVLAGTALVKTEAAWDALRHEPAQLLRILEKIGIAPGASSASL